LSYKASCFIGRERKMAKTTLFMSLVVVLTWSMGLAQVANAQNSEAKTLKDWNLESLTKSHIVQRLDLTVYGFGGNPKETEVEWYGKFGKKEKIGILSVTVENKKLIYGLVHIIEGQASELRYIDSMGSGQFVPHDTSIDIVVPDWVINEYRRSVTSYDVYANNDSNTFHERNCFKLNSEDLIKFDSPQEARDSGAKPCKDCNPIDYNDL